jgi:hypothetical protein
MHCIYLLGFAFGGPLVVLIQLGGADRYAGGFG